ncbi:MAG: phosphoribosyltransferase, partial [Gammaproteobacteria bacterium]
RCELVTWEHFYQLARELAWRVRKASFNPEVIVAIGRGGYMPARILSDYLDILDLACIKVEHYHGAHKDRSAQVRHPLVADIAGKRVLLVDDVSDTGDTFQVAIDHLRKRGEPAELKSAVLHHKRISDYVPDYFSAEVVEWRWIIYPWAVIEDLSSFLHALDPLPATTEAFAGGLLEQHGITVRRQILQDVLELSGGKDRPERAVRPG